MRWILLAIPVVAFLWWPPPAALQNALRVAANAERIELYALDPRVDAASLPPPSRLFHRWKIIGRTALEGDEKASVLRTLWRGACGVTLMRAGCFNPRHGVRVVADGVTYDLAVCFECGGLELFEDENRTWVDFGGSARNFNDILQRHGVPLPPEGF